MQTQWVSNGDVSAGWNFTAQLSAHTEQCCHLYGSFHIRLLSLEIETSILWGADDLGETQRYFIEQCRPPSLKMEINLRGCVWDAYEYEKMHNIGQFH